MKSLLQFLFALILVFCFSIMESQSQIAGQVPIDPAAVPQFVDPLPHFAGIRVDATSGGYLDVKMVPTTQVALSTGTLLPGGGIVGVTEGAGVGNYWVYSISANGGPYTPPLWPAFTIETHRGNPLSVFYHNELDGTYEDVNLIVDQTLHWADPESTEDPYDGPIPAVVHLHGAEVASESDGGPDAWFTYGSVSERQTGPSWGVGGTDDEYYYSNSQEGTTLWYHDHALGVTRLNVYAGLAGFYFLRENNEDDLELPGWSGDDLVQEVAPAGASGTFQPEPYLPEIEVVIQDRMFDCDGELYFPNLPTNPSEHPFWTPEFLGDIITVNGKTWPYLSVAPRKYRFRFLNGSNARFYELWLQDLASGVFGPAIVQIGTDGGFMDAPVVIDPALGGKLVMGPGERFDLIIDFTGTDGMTWTLRNSGRTPYPKGEAPKGNTLGRIMQFVVNGTMVSADDHTQPGIDNSSLPANLRPEGPLVKLTDFAGNLNVVQDFNRQLVLVEVMGTGGPLEMLVNNTKWDGNGMDDPEDPDTWGLATTEVPSEGNTEVWKIINLTADAHPMHMHLVQYQLVSRQKFRVNKYMNVYGAAFPSGTFEPAYGPPGVGTLPPDPDLMDRYNSTYDFITKAGYLGGNPDVMPYLQGPMKPPEPNEQGWKDTFIMYPGEVTTVVVRFAPTDVPANGATDEELTFGFNPAEGPGYVWHCHIIDHEDNEMMRPMMIASNPMAHMANGSPGTNLPPVVEKTIELPDGFELDQNNPNPFSSQTEINFRLAYETHTTLTLYNSMGETVRVLIDEMAPEGEHSVKLDAVGLEEGIYYYQLSTGIGSRSGVKKMVVIH